METAAAPAAERFNWMEEAGDEQPREVVTLTDPRTKKTFVIELEGPDPLTDAKVGQIAGDAIKRYITGDPSKNRPAFPFMVDGVEKQTNAQFWFAIANVAAMQPEGWSLPFDPYSIDELAQLAYKRRGLWLQLWRKSEEIIRAAEGGLPNDSGAGASA